MNNTTAVTNNTSKTTLIIDRKTAYNWVMTMLGRTGSNRTFVKQQQSTNKLRECYLSENLLNNFSINSVCFEDAHQSIQLQNTSKLHFL